MEIGAKVSPLGCRVNWEMCKSCERKNVNIPERRAYVANPNNETMLNCPKCGEGIDYGRYLRLYRLQSKRTARLSAEVAADPSKHPLNVRITANVNRIPRFLVEFSRMMNTTAEEITGPRRWRRVVVPRHVAMWFLANQSGLTLENIGRIFNRDHSSVHHAAQRIDDLLETKDSEVAFAVESIHKIALDIWSPRVR